MSEEKQKAIQAALDKITKDFGKGSIMKLGERTPTMQVETFPTGSLSLDIVLGVGGIPKGCIIEVYGPESGGKTTLALHMVAEVQKQNGIAAFIDAEHALDRFVPLRQVVARMNTQPYHSSSPDGSTGLYKPL